MVFKHLNDEELNEAYTHETARLRRAVEQLEQCPLWRIFKRWQLRREAEDASFQCMSLEMYAR